MTSTFKSHPLLKIMRNALMDMPSPANISVFWNLGLLLGLCLGVQIVSGLFLSMHYCGDVMSAFNSVNYGWLLRMVHANGASLFFICLFLYMGRGLYYVSYLFTHTWVIGVVIMLMVMATAFLGYVLPWGQMSFWGATVITNLFSAIPYLGGDLVTWLWGGFAVDKATLTYLVFFRCLFIVLVLMLIMSSVFFILKHYWQLFFRLSVYLVSQLLVMYIFINVFGYTPKPLMASTIISPELSLKPELVHASITAVLTNWPHSYGQYKEFLEASKLVSFSHYETKYLQHLQGMFKERYNMNKHLNDVHGYSQVRSTDSMEPVHQVYSYLRCPLPAQFKEDSHLSTNNLINRSDVFFTMKDPALMHRTLTALSY